MTQAQLQYREYLKSEHWRETRSRKVAERRLCDGCDCAGPFDVHHLTYANLGAEPMNDLMCLCRACHTETHEIWDLVPRKFPPDQIRACLRHWFYFRRYLPQENKRRKQRIKRTFNHLPMEIRNAFAKAKRRWLAKTGQPRRIKRAA